MGFKCLKLATVATALVLSTSVNAALLDFGTFSTDDDTGLDWLDMSYTDGMSYNSVLAATNGGSLDGWTIASSAQVVEMITNHLGHAPVDGVNGHWDSLNYGVIDIQSMIGSTYGTTGQNAYTVGYTSDNSLADPTRQLTLQFGWYTGNPGEGYYRFDSWGSLSDETSDFIGTFLVRGDSLNAVPVPAAVWLFGSGLIGLVGVARRKKA